MNAMARPIPALPCAGHELGAIEARRVTLGMSRQALERAAGLPSLYYSRILADRHAPRPATVARLKMAHKRHELRQAAGGAERDFMVSIAYRMAVTIAATTLGREAGTVHAQDPARRATQDPEWMAAAEVRRLAFYMLNTMLGLTQTDIAKAAGLTKQAVQQAIPRVEDLAEEGSPFETTLEALRMNIMGDW